MNVREGSGGSLGLGYRLHLMAILIKLAAFVCIFLQSTHSTGRADKTLCEILTVTDAMQLPMAGPKVDGNLSGTVPDGRLFNGEATALGSVIWCLGSGTWLKNPAPIPAGVLTTVQIVR